MIVVSIFVLREVKRSFNQEKQISIVETKPKETDVISADEIHNKELKDLWTKNKNKNNDYIGQITFISNLIDLPFVCPHKGVEEYNFFDMDGKRVIDISDGCSGRECDGNDIYLKLDWQTMDYINEGSIFMDYRNSIDDQNIIIYGHHYAPSYDVERIKMFTPLEKLLEKDNYENNKNLEIVLEDEIRRYEVVYVYIYHLDAENYDDYDTLQFYRTNYNYDFYGNADEGYYQKYIDKLEKVKLYDTGKKLTTNDKTLTLQTCITHKLEEKQIVVCREIERVKY